LNTKSFVTDGAIEQFSSRLTKVEEDVKIGQIEQSKLTTLAEYMQKSSSITKVEPMVSYEMMEIKNKIRTHSVDINRIENSQSLYQRKLEATEDQIQAVKIQFDVSKILLDKNDQKTRSVGQELSQEKLKIDSKLNSMKENFRNKL
jgi:hypothetical protein